MNKLSFFKYILLSLIIVSLVPLKGYAQWILYDDFDSGSIDNSLWIIEDLSATINVEH